MTMSAFIRSTYEVALLGIIAAALGMLLVRTVPLFLEQLMLVGILLAPL